MDIRFLGVGEYRHFYLLHAFPRPRIAKNFDCINYYYRDPQKGKVPGYRPVSGK